jgi:hypothetical protein
MSADLYAGQLNVSQPFTQGLDPTGGHPPDISPQSWCGPALLDVGPHQFSQANSQSSLVDISYVGQGFGYRQLLLSRLCYAKILWILCLDMLRLCWILAWFRGEPLFQYDSYHLCHQLSIVIMSFLDPRPSRFNYFWI